MTEPAERRIRLGQQIIDGEEREVGGPPSLHAAERVDPASRLRERHAHEVAPAVPRPATERDQRAEGRQVATPVVHDLRREVLRTIEAAAESLLVRHPADGLDQRLAPAALAPGPAVEV